MGHSPFKRLVGKTQIDHTFPSFMFIYPFFPLKNNVEFIRRSKANLEMWRLCVLYDLSTPLTQYDPSFTDIVNVLSTILKVILIIIIIIIIMIIILIIIIIMIIIKIKIKIILMITIIII